MTSIEWTDKTWNPIVGCSIVSPGCTNCYAMKMAARQEAMRFGTGHYVGTTKKVKGIAIWAGKIAQAPEATLLEPLRRKKPTMYFVNSMGDLFHESIPDEWIDRVFAVMALCPQHTFQVLTKRAERMLAWASRHSGQYSNGAQLQVYRTMSGYGSMPKPRGFGLTSGFVAVRMAAIIEPSGWPLPNVWLGVSTEDQTRADERIPLLLQTPAAIRFISAEPLIGPIDVSDYLVWSARTNWDWYLDWVIAGGESGRGARPMHPDWPRKIRDDCRASDVAFFFKQWGRYAPQHDDPAEAFFASHKGETPDHVIHKGWCFGRSATQRPWFMFDLGKKTAGRKLDGKEHNEFPKAKAGEAVAA